MNRTFIHIAPEILARFLLLDEHDIRIGAVFTEMNGTICAELIGDGLPEGRVCAAYQKHENGTVVLKAIQPA